MSDGQRPGDDRADDRPTPPPVPRPEYPGPDAEASGVPPWPTQDYPAPPPQPPVAGEQASTAQPVGPPAGWRPAPPNHPDANTAMVLGIVGVAGGFMCFLPIVMAPFAWVMGARVVREVDASNGALGGRAEGQAGKIMGIIGTVLLVLAILAVVAFVVLLLAIPSTFDDV